MVVVPDWVGEAAGSGDAAAGLGEGEAAGAVDETLGDGEADGEGLGEASRGGLGLGEPAGVLAGGDGLATGWGDGLSATAGDGDGLLPPSAWAHAQGSEQARSRASRMGVTARAIGQSPGQQLAERGRCQEAAKQL